MKATLVYLVRAAGAFTFPSLGAFVCHFISNFCSLQQGLAEGETLVLYDAMKAHYVCTNMEIKH